MGGALASSPMFSFLAESIVGARRDAVDDYADAVDAGHESTASLRSAPAESRAAATQQSAPPVESQGLVVEDMLKQASHPTRAARPKRLRA